MLSLFVGPEKQGVDFVRLLAKYRGAPEASSRLFQPVDVPVHELFRIVPSIDEANMILLPHDYAAVAHDHEFIRAYEALAETSGKTIVVFSYSDRDVHPNITHTLILRTSAYRSTLCSNEIIVPPFIENLGETYGVTVRKKGGVPTVGFMGLAAWPTTRSFINARLRQALLCVRALGNQALRARTQGIFIRRRALALLAHSPRVKLLSTVRSSFSALEKTVSVPAQQARQEYVSLMQQSDFCLAPKGDGNYSLRFFEALSLGRIPVLIDTDTVLPFADKIQYDDVIVRVPFSDIDYIADRIADAYAAWTPEQFAARQKRAREIFETFLKPSAFYSRLFDEFAHVYGSR